MSRRITETIVGIFANNFVEFFLISASIWGFLEAVTYFKGDWLKEFLGGFWWVIIYGIPTAFVVVKYVIIKIKIATQTNSINSQQLSPPPNDLTREMGTVQLIFQRLELSFKPLNEAFRFYHNGAVERLYYTINGQLYKEIFWEKCVFIPLEIGVTYHVEIEYDIANHIVLLRKNIPFLFDFPATDKARLSNYKKGGHAECHITLRHQNPIEQYIYKPSSMSIWEAGELKRINPSL